MRQFKVHIKDGEITEGGDYIRAYIQSLDNGDYAVNIEEWKDKRSLRQNALMWKWISIMADSMGYQDPEYLYDILIDMFAPVYTVEDLDGNPQQKRLTTSRMDTKQMADFMRDIDQLAAEYNIQLPRPEDDLLTS